MTGRELYDIFKEQQLLLIYCFHILGYFYLFISLTSRHAESLAVISEQTEGTAGQVDRKTFSMDDAFTDDTPLLA